MIYPKYSLPEMTFIKHCLTHTTISGAEAAALAILLHKVDEHLKILQIEYQNSIPQPQNPSTEEISEG